MLRKKDCCGCGDWKSQIKELWMKYQSVVKGIKAGPDTVYPDGDGIADIDGAIENEVARQISEESLVTQSDLSEAIADFATVDQLDTGLATVAAAKQDKLVNQLNIKSVNGQSLLGNGNLHVLAEGVDWSEIENKPTFATVATSGSYDDLTDKPTIPSAQVNSDWNADSGVAQILNKPSLASVATSGSYDDLTNKPTIPAAQVNADWNAASGVAQILNKPTVPALYSTWNGENTDGAVTQKVIYDHLIGGGYYWVRTLQINSLGKLDYYGWNAQAASGMGIGTVDLPAYYSKLDLSNTVVSDTNAGKYLKVASDGTIAYDTPGGGGGFDPSVADLIASVKGRIVNAWSGVDPTPSVKYINDSGNQTYGASASMTVLGKSVTVTSSSTTSIGTLGTHDVYKQTFSMSYGGNNYSFDMLIFYQSD